MKHYFNEYIDGDIKYNFIDNKINLITINGEEKMIYLKDDGYQIEDI